MERIDIGANGCPHHMNFLIITKTMDRIAKRSLEMGDPERDLSKFTQAKGRPMLRFRSKSKPSVQNRRNCIGVGVRD